MNRSQLDHTLLAAVGIAERLRFADVFDILVCAFLIYTAITWLRERTAYSVAAAILIAGTVYVGARYYEMYLTLQAIRIGLPLLLIVLVVVFQEDLRRAFERAHRWRPWSKSRGRNLPSEVIDILVEAVMHMAEQRIGALIVLRGRESLDRHCRGGELLDGLLSNLLLQSIFHPSTPGHDGAIIVSGTRIERFAVHLPLSSNREMLGTTGTRHAAGLGLAELCDALVIVVSEERGTVSVASERTLSELEGAAELRNIITAFREETDGSERDDPFHWARHRLGLKLVSLTVASVLWISWVHRTDKVQQAFDQIPVLIRNLPEGWEVGKLEPEKVLIRVTGAERSFDFLNKEELAVSLDFSQPVEGTHTVQITDDRLKLPSGLSLSQAEPEQIRLWLYRVVLKELPIRIQQLGSPPRGYRIRQIDLQPPSIKVIIPESQTNSVSDATVAIDWEQIEFESQPVRLKSRVTLPAGYRRQPNAPESIEVIIHWETDSEKSKTLDSPTNPPENSNMDSPRSLRSTQNSVARRPLWTANDQSNVSNF
ncbi:MAG TPA: diadenylate cyclase [Planctomycetaceae bacterium]|nr:diadenylate cyclase [Planctomycetaceae bacterium]